jgi:galactose-1-phosphate uridylyltransferase
MIRFERHQQCSTFHNPMLGNELDTQHIEVRRDPLTGATSLWNVRLQDTVAMFFGATDQLLIERLARESEPRCFLCGDRWQQMTPTYPAALVPAGRIQRGEVVLFPNIFPVCQVHAVIRVGARHSLALDEFDPALLGDVLAVAHSFVRTIAATEPSAAWLTINANYLGPAGASIAHPHFQVVGGDLPMPWLEQTLAASRAWMAQHGACYWTELVAQEQKLQERFIGHTGPVAWLSTFSPQGTNEVLGVLPARKDWLQCDEQDWAGIALGLSALLRGYKQLGISTCNLAMYSGPLGAGDEAFRCCVRLVSRQNVYENYRTDDFFLQKLLRAELILTTPEALASSLRGVLARQGSDA